MSTEGLPSITCPQCGMTSCHPRDVEAGYCGKCHEFTGTPEVKGRKRDPEEPSQAEKDAQAWHERNHADRMETCWCCCGACRALNPHNLAARRAALDDIAARLESSMANIRLPERFGKRL